MSPNVAFGCLSTALGAIPGMSHRALKRVLLVVQDQDMRPRSVTPTGCLADRRARSEGEHL